MRYLLLVTGALLLAASSASGAEKPITEITWEPLKPGLRARLALSLPLGVNKWHQFDIPRTDAGIRELSWVQYKRPTFDTYQPELVMYCPKDDFTFCALFDQYGYISGLQWAVPQATFVTVQDLEAIGFYNWTAPADSNGNVADYWATNMYFMSEETYALDKAGRGALHQNNESLYDTGVWVRDFNASNIIKLSRSVPELLETHPYTKQSCIFAMGLHYYYNMSPTTSCDQLYPWAALTLNGQVHGFSLNIVGRFPNDDSKTNWYERPPNILTRAVTPRGPQCLYDLSTKYGLTSQHLYFVDNGMDIFCLAE